MSRVMIRKASYDDLIPTVHEILEAFPLDVRGKKVFIKPNLVSHTPPAKGATTHPLLLKAIGEEVEKRGGTPWIGDNGVDVQDLYRTTELEKICAPYLVNISKGASLLEIGGYQVPISKPFLEADLFINVPKLKTHRIAGMTCCLKNPFGLIPAYSKARMHALTGHAKKLTEFFVELYRLKIPALNIVDGILAMEGEGPNFGTPREVGKVIAGKDGVAVDAVCALLIGYKSPREIKLIDLAEKKGLGNLDLNHHFLDGPFEVIEDFVHPASYTVRAPGGKSILATNAEEALRTWNEVSHLNPVGDKEACTRCGECLPACPTQAILLDPYPKIEPAKCLGCLCCVEACPEKALSVSMSEELRERSRQMGL